jgi:hypothetical protein
MVDLFSNGATAQNQNSEPAKNKLDSPAQSILSCDSFEGYQSA